MIGLPLIGIAFSEMILGFNFEFISVKDDPVSNSADILKLLMVTVEVCLDGVSIEKQLDSTAQKLMTAAGKRFELRTSHFP